MAKAELTPPDIAAVLRDFTITQIIDALEAHDLAQAYGCDWTKAASALKCRASNYASCSRYYAQHRKELIEKNAARARRAAQAKKIAKAEGGPKEQT
jgi:hypothetical protein